MSYRPLNSIEYLVIHHPVGAYDVDDFRREFAARHEGYNAVVVDDRDPYNGQSTFAELLPMTTISNGTYGINYQAWNVCVVKGNGNFETTPVTMADDCVKKLVQVLATKARLLGWRKKDVSRIVGHQFAGLYLSSVRYGTACPGRNMIALIPQIRLAVARYLPA